MTAGNAKQRVLVVDDEPGIVNAVRRELSAPGLSGMGFEIETFTDPLAALERARNQTFAAVISDYRMPEMNGLALLTALGEIQPDCARIVLSGQTDFDALVRMINETHIYRFIPKPWSTYFLRNSLAQAIGLRQATLDNRRLAGLLRQQGAEFTGGINAVDQVLVVDDDVNEAHGVARCLKRRSRLDDVFRAVSTEMQRRLPGLDPSHLSVQITDSPLHAMKMADEVRYSCVITDYRMPAMDGGQLLMAFAARQPDCMCIMMSEQANLEDVVIALDLANLYAFIAKPWDDHGLRSTVAQALMQRRLKLENAVLAQLCRDRKLDAGVQATES